MNTYTVIWYPPSATAGTQATVQATQFIVNEDYALFMDAAGEPVLAIPRSLSPVVTRAA